MTTKHFLFNVQYHLYLYLILKLQLTPLLDNAVKMTSKCRSFILLIFSIKCILRCFRIRNYTYGLVISFPDTDFQKTSGGLGNHYLYWLRAVASGWDSDYSHLSGFDVSSPYVHSRSINKNIFSGFSLWIDNICLAFHDRNLKQEQCQIRLNLVIAIAVAQIIFLAGIDATSKQVTTF